MKIRLEKVSKCYGRKPALREVSCEFEPGQLIAVLGPNGAGKTTLLRCLAGIVAPSSGCVWFDGEVFRRGRLDLRRRLHFLPEWPLVYGELDMARYAALVLQSYEVVPDGYAEKLIELWREFDLLPLYANPLHTFWRGQLYKTALSVLIALEPELWLLDEPFASGMDPHGLTAFRRLAGQAVQRGVTVIYSTQILDVAERFADRVCVLDRGELRTMATQEEIRQRTPSGESALEALLESLRSSEK